MVLGQNDWVFQIDPKWGESRENVATPNNGHALLFVEDRLLLATDHPDHNIIEYDSTGEVVDAWGRQWPGLHGIKAHGKGDELSLFLVDSGWILNPRWDGISVDKWDSPYNKMIPQAGSVAKTTRNGKVLFSIGHPVTVGAYRQDMPFNPTDVAVMHDGDFFVVDGYGSDYILHYDRFGQYVKKFGQDAENKDESIHNGHGITIDERGSEPLLLVSSRADHCLKWFSMDGKFVKKVAVPGAFIHAPLFLDEHLAAPVCWTGNQDHPKDDSGVICIFDSTDQLVSVLGGELPDKGKNVHNHEGIFKHCHGLEKDCFGNLYLAQWKAGGIHPQKLLRVR